MTPLHARRADLTWPAGTQGPPLVGKSRPGPGKFNGAAL
jgi:hypothetical protein